MIDDGVDALLRPLERFEEIRHSVVRLGDRLADLSYANPYDGTPADVCKVLRAVYDDLRPLDLQYTPHGGNTLVRRAIADHHLSRWEIPLVPSDIVLAGGAAGALQLVVRAVGSFGDEVIVLTPCWIDHPLAVAGAGRHPVLVPLSEPEFRIDVAAVEAAITPRTCAAIISNPVNPAARVHDDRHLRALATVLRAAEDRFSRPISLVLDEAHRDFVAPNGLRTGLETHHRSLALYSFGKSHYVQGERIGYVAVSPLHPERAVVSNELVRWNRILAATPPASLQRAVPGLIGLPRDLGAIHARRDRFVAEVVRAGLEVVRPEGTPFVYVRTPGGADDFEYARMLARRGLLVIPAPVFHSRGWFRLAITASAPMRARAVQILASTP